MRREPQVLHNTRVVTAFRWRDVELIDDPDVTVPLYWVCINVPDLLFVDKQTYVVSQIGVLF
jgi:hypothetical protein